MYEMKKSICSYIFKKVFCVLLDDDDVMLPVCSRAVTKADYDTVEDGRELMKVGIKDLVELLYLSRNHILLLFL